MLHRNTNKITLVLLYAILEWILIILLLLNSLFSYFIIKFAHYFRLKTPCMLCARIDHIIESEKNMNPCRDLVCEAHAIEIFKLGFCSNHHKLAESNDMCDNCLSSQSFDFFPMMKEMDMIDGVIEKVTEKVEVGLNCSCCGVNFDNRFYPPCVLNINPSMNILDYGQKQNMVKESVFVSEVGHHSDEKRSDFELVHHENQENIEEALEDEALILNVPNPKDDDDDEACDKTTVEIEKNVEILQKHLEFVIHGDDYRLIPVEIVDSTARKNGNKIRYHKVVDEEFKESEDFILDFDMNTCAEAEPLIAKWHISGDIVAEFSCQENKDVSMVNEVESDQLNYQDVRFGNVEVNAERMMNGDGELCSYVSLASEDASQTQGEEYEAEVSIGTEIPDQEQVDEYQEQDFLLDTNQRMQEDSSTSSLRFCVQDDSGNNRGEEEFVEFKTMSLEVRMPTSRNHIPSSSLEPNENEEESFPDTLTSIANLHQVHKKLLFLERKDSGATDDSLDGSVISNIECSEVTFKKLKSALKTERKALKTLYAELEEERNASAVAANQTMAMINRHQEEKAAMQMEALQYQRMMDEQSEYDQEAMQLLNDLMLKREKEKHELEKELEVYRKKVHEYEVREKMMLSRRDSIRSRNSSPSCSNTEDSDELSIDFNQETKEENGFHSNQNTPVDGVLYLEESLSNFEEERLSILEKLKMLEEKLIILNYKEDEEEEFDNSTTSIEHLHEENGNGYHNHDNRQGHVNGFVNGNGKPHHGRRITATKAKRLLPLFGAIGTEEDVELSGDESELEFLKPQNISAEKTNLDKKKVGLEEEVDHVYERLQVLEADREFLKHCISSLRKGDKGIDLLQEILQHLRDLRNVELRVRNIGDLAAV